MSGLQATTLDSPSTHNRPEGDLLLYSQGTAMDPADHLIEVVNRLQADGS